MRLSAITDAILEEAVRAQPTDEFDSHDVIFWISRNHPCPYAQDLYLALQDEGDPFVNLHTAIGRRLVCRASLVRQQHTKRTSVNVRGETTECEVWRRVPRCDRGSLAPRLVPLREMLINVARRGGVTHYGPVADLLGIRTERLDHCRELSEALDEISTFEHANGRPLLSVVVVRKPDEGHQEGHDMRPGGGFFKMAKRNGVQKPDEDDEAFFAAQLRRAHDYWQSHARPSGERG